jgi:hypothetical protein
MQDASQIPARSSILILILIFIFIIFLFVSFWRLFPREANGVRKEAAVFHVEGLRVLFYGEDEDMRFVRRCLIVHYFCAGF